MVRFAEPCNDIPGTSGRLREDLPWERPSHSTDEWSRDSGVQITLSAGPMANAENSARLIREASPFYGEKCVTRVSYTSPSLPASYLVVAFPV